MRINNLFELTEDITLESYLSKCGIDTNEYLKFRTNERYEHYPNIKKAVEAIIYSALKNTENGLGKYKINIDDDAVKLIAKLSSGDFRSALNLLEMSYFSSDNHQIDVDLVKTINSKPVIVGDNNGNILQEIIGGDIT